MLPIIISTVGGLVKTWLSNKAEKQQAKHTRDVKVIEQTSNWEAIQAKISGASWTDEWLTVLFSIPLIMCFIPSLVPYVELGFTALDKMPEWYRYYLGVIVAATFGVRQVINFKGKK